MFNKDDSQRTENTTVEPTKQPLPTAGKPDKRTAWNDAYSCAVCIEQVEAAWQLVYERYVQKKLIDSNPFHLHTVPMAIGEHACVICESEDPGSAGREIHSTVTLIGDSSQGLPLDSVYREQLDGLRRIGRHPVEVGLLADCRRHASRSPGALFSLMRWAIYYTLHTHYTDIVIGVHPHHAAFYMRGYGFEKLALPKRYALVRDNPVLPLRLPVSEVLAHRNSRGINYARDNPLPASAFSRRFRFEAEQLRGSLIERFLNASLRKGTATSAPPGAANAASNTGVLPGNNADRSGDESPPGILAT